MIVCHKKKFIFIHNPKAAGTSFRMSISGYHDHPREFWGTSPDNFFCTTVDLAHLRSWELPIVAPGVYEHFQEYTTLAFARDPEQRFISAAFEHFRNFKNSLSFPKLDVPAQQEHLYALIDSDLTMEKVISDVRYVHFSPQTWFFYSGRKRIVKHILPLFTEQADFAAAYDILELPRAQATIMNRSSRDRVGALLTPKLRAFVRQFYAIDYAMFGLHPYLAPLLPTADAAAAQPATVSRIETKI
jgi:hypothetical protein